MKARTLLALAPAALLPLAFTAGPAAASDSTTYQTTLKPVVLNGQNNATGEYMIKLDGMKATITGTVSGLAKTFNNAPFPHVQHIHGEAKGMCPTSPDADTDGDGVISTSEGGPFYGGILTTLTLSGDTTPDSALAVDRAVSGESYKYSRTIDLDQKTVDALKAGTAAIVVHGLDPATAPKAATEKKSELLPDLPLAATAPALCGVLTASQMGAMPSGGVETGGAAPTNGPSTLPLFIFGGAALTGAGVLMVNRRRQTDESA